MYVRMTSEVNRVASTSVQANQWKTHDAFASDKTPFSYQSQHKSGSLDPAKKEQFIEEPNDESVEDSSSDDEETEYKQGRYTSGELKYLKGIFAKNPSPKKDVITKIYQTLDRKSIKIQNWFRYMRKKHGIRSKRGNKYTLTSDEPFNIPGI